MPVTNNLYFHPQSISNRDVQFQNGEQDKIKFSYTGSFTQKGTDYEEISLPNLYKVCNSWNSKMMNNTTDEQLDRPQLGLRVKFFYVVRNFKALNSIIKTKNKQLIEADKKWANESTFIKVATFVLKLITFCQFDLLQHLQRKYENKPRHAELRTLQLFDRCERVHSNFFINAMQDGFDGASYSQKKAHEKNKEFFINLRVKGLTTPQDPKEKIELIHKRWLELTDNPRARLEDGFSLAKAIPGYDFEALYKMDLPNVFPGKYVNGHMVDPEYVPSNIPDEKNGYMLSDFNKEYQKYCDPNVPRYFPQAAKQI